MDFAEEFPLMSSPNEGSFHVFNSQNEGSFHVFNIYKTTKREKMGIDNKIQTEKNLKKMFKISG